MKKKQTEECQSVSRPLGSFWHLSCASLEARHPHDNVALNNFDSSTLATGKKSVRISHFFIKSFSFVMSVTDEPPTSFVMSLLLNSSTSLGEKNWVKNSHTGGVT